MKISYFLIGVPASGKSTLANYLANTGNYQIISTDTARKQLYGDESIQGNWLEIENHMLNQIVHCCNEGISIIYDATNAKRLWRMGFLQKVEAKVAEPINWVGWYFKVKQTEKKAIEICQQRNRNRTRKVPKDVIDNMVEDLQRFPPLVAEGFVKIIEIKISEELDINFINQQLTKLKKIETSLIHRKNKTDNTQSAFHRYSRLLDFDRLMHLISLLIEYPALGNLENQYPEVLKDILGEVKHFEDAIAEITAVMKKLKGDIYANPEEIANDLAFLESHQLISTDSLATTNESQPLQSDTELITVKECYYQDLITHYASDKKTFERILTTLKIISKNPFTSREEIAFQLQDLPSFQGKPTKEIDSIFRKDIQLIFNPFNIFPPMRTMRNGYFFGTGILTQEELKVNYHLLDRLAKTIDDPLVDELLKNLHDRLLWSKINDQSSSFYPYTAIAHSSFIDNEKISTEQVLSKQTNRVKGIIEKGRLVELIYRQGSPQYEFLKDHDQFKAWLLQIIFFNSAWYVALEHRDDSNEKFDGWIRLERLDRLILNREFNELTISVQEKQNKRKRLNKLLESVPGIYLGSDVKMQNEYLDREKREQIETTVELFFSEDIFNFIVEGNKRFPQLKISKPPKKYERYCSFAENQFLPKKIKGSKDRPYVFQVKFPQWSLDDFSLKRWILGFGDNVEVNKPDRLKKEIQKLSAQTNKIYSVNNNAECL